MQPTPSTTAVFRPDLGQVAYEYAMERALTRFIGLRVLPLFSVPENAGQYPIIPVESILKVPDTRRAPKGAYNRGSWEFTLDDYACKENGWEEPVDDSLKNMYRTLFDAEVVGVKRAVNIILRSQEKRIADKVFNPATFTPHNVANKWSVLADASPRSDVKAGLRAVEDAVGLPGEELSLIISKRTFDNVIECAEMKDYLKYTDAHLLESFDAQRAKLASYFGVAEVLVGNAVYDSADKGQAASISRIWSDSYGMLAPLAKEPEDLEEPCLGRTFLWQGDSPENMVTEVYREEQTRGDIIRVRHATAEKFVFPAAAYLLGNLA